MRTLLPLFALSLFVPLAVADDATTLQRSAADVYVYGSAHTHAREAPDHLLGCPTFCPIPETQTRFIVELWQESNGCPGLQRTQTFCGEATVPPDSKLRDLLVSAP